MATFQSYLDDVKSSATCCRAASLLIPTSSETNKILRQLRQWNWICDSVLIRPWRRSISDNITLEDGDHYQCLPTEDELIYLQRKYSVPSLNASDDTSDDTTILTLQKKLVQYHTHAKSLIVPLTSDATAIILHVFFELPCNKDVNGNIQTTDNNIISDALDVDQVSNKAQKIETIHKWISTSSIMIIHNCDGNQLVSLSKEVDSFPKPQSTTSTSSTHTNHDNQFIFVDLFAGVGGFRIGMQALGGLCIGSCELDQYARDTYRRNFLQKDASSQEKKDEFYVNDITRLDIPADTVDVLCGGFPCQSFSTMASFSDSTRQGGLDTPHKGRLFFHLLRILRKSRPKLFVFENVKGLMKVDNGEQFKKILQLLTESGYKVLHVIVDSSWFLPQRRERIYFIGIRLDLINEETAKWLDTLNLEKEIRRKYQLYGNDITDETCPKNLNQSSLPPSCLGDILESDETVSKHHSHCFLTPSQWQKISSQGYTQLHRDGSGQLITKDDTVAQTLVSSYRSSYLLHSQFIVPNDSVYLLEQRTKLKRDTSKASAEDEKQQHHVIDIRAIEKEASTDTFNEQQQYPRFFTTRECCRLQGFPEDFVIPKDRQLISQFYRQVGNAVSVPCVVAVAEMFVSSFLSKGDKEQHTSNAVFDTILNASPNKDKVMVAIHRKQATITNES